MKDSNVVLSVIFSGGINFCLLGNCLIFKTTNEAINAVVTRRWQEGLFRQSMARVKDLVDKDLLENRGSIQNKKLGRDII